MATKTPKHEDSLSDFYSFYSLCNIVPLCLSGRKRKFNTNINYKR